MPNDRSHSTAWSRRHFLESSLLLAGSAALGARATRSRAAAPAAGAVSQPVRVALIGCGGQGRGSHISNCLREKLVALVDPDENNLARALQQVRKLDPDVDTAAIKTFTDYRSFFDRMAKEIDAISVATPNHQHALPALMAMKLGKGCYVEKPLCFSIAEARKLAEFADRYKAPTQMGNQGHSGEGYRRLCEYIWAGAIGDVSEVHCWSDRTNGGVGPRPAALPAPKGMHWDEWIGPAPVRDYHADLHPHEWHGWHDFGNGSLGNMGCHVMDGAVWALKLGHPTTVELESLNGGSNERYPVGARIRWEFPARDGLPPVTVRWYDGRLPAAPKPGQTLSPEAAAKGPANVPPLKLELERKHGLKLDSNGSLYVGSKGIMYTGTYGSGVRIVPEEQHKAFPVPAPVLPRLKGGHFADFFRGCRGEGTPCSNFGVAARLTEVVLLGSLAMIAGPGRLDWDGPGMKVRNRPDLDRFIRRENRAGWRV